MVAYRKGLSALKAASTPSFPLQFQADFAQLRVESLQAHIQLAQACNSLRTCPPPAIAMTLGDQLQRSGKVGSQLHDSMKTFQSLSGRYKSLYQSCFDADPVSLMVVQMLQQSCLLLSQKIEAVLASCTSDRSRLTEPSKSSHVCSGAKSVLEVQSLQRVLSEISAEPVLPSSGITHAHMQMLMDTSLKLLQVRLSFPRFFFQTLQSTTIKLAITPQPKSTSDRAIWVQCESNLALKVEGVIQHGKQPGLFRKVHSVILVVSSCLMKADPVRGESKPHLPASNDLTQIAEPHNDYFSIQFLLSFPTPGFHTVSIETYVMDENGEKWDTGPQAGLTVKSYLDQTQQQNQQRAGLQYQAQRANAFP